MFGRTAKLGIAVAGRCALGLRVEGRRRRRATEAFWVHVEAPDPAELAGALVSVRAVGAARGAQLRVILPPDACENFLRVYDGPRSAEELARDALPGEHADERDEVRKEQRGCRRSPVSQKAGHAARGAWSGGVHRRRTAVMRG